jgi:hypothetical protein
MCKNTHARTSIMSRAAVDTHRGREALLRRGAFLLVVLSAVIISVWGWLASRSKNMEDRHLTLHHLVAVSELTTLRVTQHETVEHTIRGYTGGVRVIVAVVGEVSLAVDLSQATLHIQEGQAREARIILPPPSPTSPRLYHAKTRMVDIDRRGLWSIVPGSEAEVAVVDQALKIAQARLEDAGRTGASQAAARTQAERIIARGGRTLGWNVSVCWRE